MSRDYKKLEVWKLAHKLVLKTYDMTKKFPKSEWFGLISQMRRAAVSIPANIVEGAGRKGQKEYIHFLYTSLSSCNELGYYIYLSAELNFIDNREYKEMETLSLQVSKMLQGLIKRIEKDLDNSKANG